MNTSLIVKLNFLILAFVLVAMASYNVNKNGLPRAVTDLFGLPPNQHQTLNWCDTRVASLVEPDGFKIEQVANKWIREDKTRREVNFLSVEKWFGQYCDVRGQAIQPSSADLSSYKPVLFVKFINDKVEALGRAADGSFLWKGAAFKSEELEKALHELGRIEGQASQD